MSNLFAKVISRKQKSPLARKKLNTAFHLISEQVLYRLFTLYEREGRGSVVERLTQDWGVAGSSLTGITLLCHWARHIYLLSSGSTQEDLSQHTWKIVDWDVKIKSNKHHMNFLFPFQSCDIMDEKVLILISWLLRKPVDMDLHCL